MRDSLAAGAQARLSFRVPPSKTVPHLYPESDDFRGMPEVLATGFMVGLLEWACLEVLKPHLESGEGSLGTHIDVSHSAPTLPGQTVTVDAEVTAIKGRRVSFRVRAHDGLDVIGEGRHERVIVSWARFDRKLEERATAAGL